MDSTDIEVLRQAAQWRAAGHRVVLGTVVRTWGSAPRPPGALVALRGDGQVAGSASGGCIEADLAERVRTDAGLHDGPRTTRYGVDAEEARRFGLPCGGTVELVLEPLQARSRVEELLERMAAGQCVRRHLDLRTGAVTLEPGSGSAMPVLSAEALVTEHGPAWRLLIIGAGQMAQYLARMAVALDYQVTACDPREEYAEGWSIPGARLVRTMPDDTVEQMRPDAHLAVVALTHDPKLDDLALLEALRSPAFYVGAIGSRRNQDKRKERLGEFGLSAAQLARLHGPVGLKNGARTPPEIAVAILAEMTAVKYGYRVPAPVALAAAPAAAGA